MRPATVFILASIGIDTLAMFPPELDPCVNEVLAVAPVFMGIKSGSSELRELEAADRESVAKHIHDTVLPMAKDMSIPTPVPGIVIPKPETGLQQLPIVIPSETIQIPGIEVKDTPKIEFQEIIPGVKPPAIPLLLPGIERLPLMPGWQIRGADGKIVKQGDRLPAVIPAILWISVPPPI